jgi:hypothetical protein
MAEDVVEYVRFFQVIKLIRSPDELTRWKTPVRQVLEKHFIGDQARYGNYLPPGVLHQYLGELPKIRDFVGANGQGAHSRHEFVASAPGQQFRLTLEERLPNGMFVCRIIFPSLVDGPVGAFRLARVAGGQTVFFNCIYLLFHDAFLGLIAYCRIR